MLWFGDILKITLGSFRIGGLLLSMPVLGSGPLPGPVRFLFTIAVSAMLLPFQKAVPAEIWTKNGLLFLLIARELGLGLLMGFGARLIFLIVTMSLEISGLQIGFAIANIFDPQNNSQISVLSQLGVILVVLFFFGANLHHDLFRALVRSYELVPLSLPDWNMALMKDRLLFFMKSTLEISMRLAFPMMIAMLAIHVIMGIISRTTPQMNLFFNAAFSINVVAGLLLLVLTFPDMFSQIHRFSRTLVSHGYGLW